MKQTTPPFARRQAGQTDPSAPQARVGDGPRGTPVSLLRTLLRRDVEPDAVAGLIACEPVLTARVLRVANSPYYRATAKVPTIERAVVLLGFDAVRAIAAAACLARGVRRVDPATRRAALTHGLATALAAERLASAAPRAAAPADAFVAGLLHDFGAVDGAPAREARACSTDAVAIHAHAQAHGHAHAHASAAARTFAQWGLPEGIVRAIEHHHDPGAAPRAWHEFARCVQTADALAARTFPDATRAPGLAHDGATGTAAAVDRDPGGELECLLRTAVPDLVEVLS